MVDTRRVVARGRVQGVGFRYFVIRHARSLGVRGTVRNRSDGALEAVMQADTAEPIDELIQRVREGPPAARVLDVTIESVEDEGASYTTMEVGW